MMTWSNPPIICLWFAGTFSLKVRARPLSEWPGPVSRSVIKRSSVTTHLVSIMFNNNKGEYRFPFDIQWVDEETNKDLLRDFTGGCSRQWLILCELLTPFRLFASQVKEPDSFKWGRRSGSSLRSICNRLNIITTSTVDRTIFGLRHFLDQERLGLKSSCG